MTRPVLPPWAASRPVARLATTTERYPHIVPVVFCEADGAIYIPIDGKPKSGRRLQRLHNIERDPAASLLVDVYADDWRQLRWLRLDGEARTVEMPTSVATAFRAKYPQYGDTALGTSAIRLTVQRSRSWQAEG